MRSSHFCADAERGRRSLLEIFVRSSNIDGTSDHRGLRTCRSRSVGRLFSVAITACALAACSNARDLGKVCAAFTELSIQPEIETMTHEQRMDFVSRRVTENLWCMSQVNGLWANVPNYEATARYRMFRRTAEDLLAESWECPAMERLAPTLSEPIPEPH